MNSTEKAQMAMGRAMGPEQPNPQTAGLSGLGDPSEAMPEEVLELWAGISCQNGPPPQGQIPLVFCNLKNPALK